MGRNTYPLPEGCARAGQNISRAVQNTQTFEDRPTRTLSTDHNVFGFPQKLERSAAQNSQMGQDPLLICSSIVILPMISY